jgi:hypothetical protein
VGAAMVNPGVPFPYCKQRILRYHYHETEYFWFHSVPLLGGFILGVQPYCLN